MDLKMVHDDEFLSIWAISILHFPWCVISRLSIALDHAKKKKKNYMGRTLPHKLGYLVFLGLNWILLLPLQVASVG